MPRKSTNETIDLVLEELMSYPWTEHFTDVDDMEPGPYVDHDEARKAGFMDLARKIAQAVR